MAWHFNYGGLLKKVVFGRAYCMSGFEATEAILPLSMKTKIKFQLIIQNYCAMQSQLFNQCFMDIINGQLMFVTSMTVFHQIYNS